MVALERIGEHRSNREHELDGGRYRVAMTLNRHQKAR